MKDLKQTLTLYKFPFIRFNEILKGYQSYMFSWLKDFKMNGTAANFQPTIEIVDVALLSHFCHIWLIGPNEAIFDKKWGARQSSK